MNVRIRVLSHGVQVTIPGSGMGVVVRPGETFHGVRYKVLRKMGNGDHWLRERGGMRGVAK